MMSDSLAHSMERVKENAETEDDEASADEPAFEKVLEEDDGYVGFKIWKLNWRDVYNN